MTKLDEIVIRLNIGDAGARFRSALEQAGIASIGAAAAMSHFHVVLQSNASVETRRIVDQWRAEMEAQNRLWEATHPHLTMEELFRLLDYRRWRPNNIMAKKIARMMRGKYAKG